MSQSPYPRSTLFPRLVAIWVLIISLIVLMGWILDNSLLKTFLPNGIEMKANTAIGFAFAAMALFILSQSSTKSSSNLGQCFSVLPLALGIATLVEFYGHLNLHIDELFFLDTQDIYGLPGRMSL